MEASDPTATTKQDGAAAMKIHLNTHSERVNSIAFHKNCSWVAAALQNGYIDIWDYQTQTLVDSFLAHSDNGGGRRDGNSNSTTTSDSDQLLSAGLVQRGTPCNCVAFNENGLLCSGGDDTKIRFWSDCSAHQLLQFPAHQDSVRSVCFHKSRSWLVSGGYDRQIFIWDYKAPCHCVCRLAHHNAVTSVVFDDAHNYILSTSADLSLRVWDFGTIQYTKQQTPKGSGDVRVVDPTSIKLKYTQAAHEFRLVENVAVSGSTVASVGQDCKVRLWELDAGHLKKGSVLVGHTNYVSACCILPGGHIVSCSEDGSIVFWDRETHQATTEIVRNSSSPPARFWSIKSSSHDTVIAAAHEDGLLVLDYNDCVKNKETVAEWEARDFVPRGEITSDPYSGEHALLKARFDRSKRTNRTNRPIYYLFCCILAGPIGVVILAITNAIRHYREKKQSGAGDCELQAIHAV